jgi:hypothetical protein
MASKGFNHGKVAINCGEKMEIESTGFALIEKTI